MPERERTSPRYESSHELYKNYTTKKPTQKAKTLKLTNYGELNKRGLALAITEAQMEKDGNYCMEGILDDTQPGDYGFLRTVNYSKGEKDIYISASQIRRFEIKRGDRVTGKVRKPKGNEKYCGLLQVGFVNDHSVEEVKRRPYFQASAPLYSDEYIKLETEVQNYSTRIMDLVIPIGLGQHGLIVAPPKAGKTSLLKEIVNAISTDKSNAELPILLIGECPEEVTGLERSTEVAEVVHSTFDEPPEHHVRVAKLLLERTRRLVEIGEDVTILMDSTTKLARTYNLIISPGGRALSGGLDPASLHKLKAFFGAARNIEVGGNLAILATALVDTGSRMDDMIYEEFKETGNMELYLGRRLSERRIFLAVDIGRNSTCKEELLVSKSGLDALWQLRNLFTDSTDFIEKFIRKLKRSKNNEDFFKQLQKSAGENAKTD